LQCAGVFADALALGRFWAFDLFIDNGDRLLKGANAANFIVAPGGVLHGIDQNIGPAPRQSATRARAVTRRRIEPLLGSSSRRELSRAVLADLRREARGTDLGDEALFCPRFELGLLASLQSLGHADRAELDAALEPLRQRPGCPRELREVPGLGAIVAELAAFGSQLAREHASLQRTAAEAEGAAQREPQRSGSTANPPLATWVRGSSSTLSG
jgi:hypothetical protein